MPSKFIWRQVPAETADELEFTHGGEKSLIWTGIFCFSACLVLTCLGLQFLPMARDMIVSFLQMKAYSAVGLLYVFFSLIWLKVAQNFLMGVWLIFGRTTLRVSLVSHSIISTRWVRAVHVFSRSYQTDGVASISLHRGRGLWGVLGLLSVYLNYNTSKSRKLFMLPRKFPAEGLKMAGQIADFVGVPLISEFALKPGDARKPQMDKPA